MEGYSDYTCIGNKAISLGHNICNMGTHDLPDMYAHSCQVTCQANHSCPCYNYKIHTGIPLLDDKRVYILLVFLYVIYTCTDFPLI